MHMANDQVYSLIRSLSNEFLLIIYLAQEVILNGKLRINFIYFNVMRPSISAITTQRRLNKTKLTNKEQ